ncbi:MAG: histidine triad nucleotide-binding protein [Patescibacteria group bacterium]
MKQENCVFCKIINKEIPSTPVFEDDDLIVINDRDPKAPVHMLIMPKKHIVNLDALTEEDFVIVSKILMTAQRLAKEKDILGRYKVVTNVGEIAGQTVMHMHFHVLGGWNSNSEVTTQLKQQL